ncbi:MAG: BlaI/MecI/CopY family transcriptional regulator [Phycisphaerae bacterium]
MPQKPLPNITAAELKILKVLWRIGPASVRAVKDELEAAGDESPAYTTVMTLMNQLAAKGGLEVDRARQPFIYRTQLRRDQVLGDRLRQFVRTVFDDQAGELVLRLVDEAKLSDDDLKRIEQRIEARERQDAFEKPARGANSKLRTQAEEGR